MDHQVIKRVLKEVVDLILNKEYEVLYAIDPIKRVTPKGLEEAINEYPGILTYPPVSAYDDFDAFQINNNSKEILIDFYLWFDNEKSELMIVVKIIEHEDGIKYALWDIYAP